MKKFFFICSFVIIGTFLFMGQKKQDKPEKWNTDPLQTGVYDPSVISGAPLPQAFDYYNPNAVTRVLKNPNGTFAINPNVRVLPRTNSYQSEVIICRHPLNPLIMFGSSNAINNVGGSLFISEGVYVTTNGGVNWFGSDTLNGAPITNHGGDPGPTIDKNGTLIMTHLGFAISGMYGNYSTDNGLTWSPNFTIQSGSVDKNLAGTDDSPTSTYYGRSYCVYVTFSSPYPARISYTSNSGVSWSAPTNIIPPAAGYVVRGTDVRTGRNGEVYVCWANNVGSTAEDFASFAKSTDGGVTFTGNNNVFDMNGLLVFGTGFAPYGIRMNSFPRIDVDRSGGPRDGWIYIVVSQKNLAPAGSDADIVLHRSTNGGTTWSPGIRVNQDPINNGKLQFYNAIRVDESGGVNIVYYDNRNTAADSAQVMLSRSVDGGDTWTDVVVSDHRFRPKPVSLSGVASGYAGDYIGVTSGNSKVWPIWMDDITGIHQAWTTSIDIGPVITHTPLPNTEQIIGNYTVNCVITPANSGINPSKTKLFWSRNNPTVTDSLLMTNSSGNNWTENIPANGSSATYRYYITTTDSLNRTATSPSGAPTNLNTFIAATDNQNPLISHSPLPDQPKPNWPATVTATVTDNLGLDSVWVKWYKNSIINTKLFKLINTSGSNYSAIFNSVNSDVNIGDVIYYRIYAQDISIAHNKDSTVLYSFNIIDQKLCEGFFSVTFPPVNWSIEFTGTNYWTRNSVSSYGVGSGSAKFDFWFAPSGTNQSLVTLTFSSSLTGDSLKFDHAYAPYTTGTDSLIIESSTNAGISFSALVRLYGRAGGGPLNTDTTKTTPYTPPNNKWATKKYALPVGTNKIKFRAKSGFGNNLYLDSICIVNNAAPVPANITLAEEGFYNTAINKLNIRDTVRAYLRNITPPYNIVDSGKTVIDSVTSTGSILFSSAGTSTYYLQIKHRNALETWSKSGGESYVKGTVFSYNFTTVQTQAYGNNMTLVGSKYCMFSGDIDQNGIIDASDLSLVYNAAQISLSGYVREDVTGDNYVDVSDISITYNNQGVAVESPLSAPTPGKKEKIQKLNKEDNVKDNMKYNNELEKMKYEMSKENKKIK